LCSDVDSVSELQEEFIKEINTASMLYLL
jgi:hypothetical protein